MSGSPHGVRGTPADCPYIPAPLSAAATRTIGSHARVDLVVMFIGTFYTPVVSGFPPAPKALARPAVALRAEAGSRTSEYSIADTEVRGPGCPRSAELQCPSQSRSSVPFAAPNFSSVEMRLSSTETGGSDHQQRNVGRDQQDEVQHGDGGALPQGASPRLAEEPSEGEEMIGAEPGAIGECQEIADRPGSAQQNIRGAGEKYERVHVY